MQMQDDLAHTQMKNSNKKCRIEILREMKSKVFKWIREVGDEGIKILLKDEHIEAAKLHRDTITRFSK